jgi:hypothetical protein
MQMSDRDLLILLERVPNNFTIGKDAFGWWYSTNGGASKIVGFPTAVATLFHYAESVALNPNR